MDVSVIIVNYNTQKLTQQCVDSLFAKTSGIDFEVILIDNGSSDGSRDLFSADERITYIYSEENLGFGKANNLGARNAQGDYLFFLNSDTYLVNNAIGIFFDYARSARASKIGFIGTLLRDAEGNINGYGDSFPTIWKSIKTALHIPSPRKMPEDGIKTPFDVDYVVGADMFVSKKVFDEVGGFDEAFFMYFEESDLQYRSYKKGYRNVIIGEPQIVHLEGGSQQQRVSHQKLMMVEESHLRYQKKHHHRCVYGFFMVLYFLLRLPTLFGPYSMREKNDYLSLLIKWM